MMRYPRPAAIARHSSKHWWQHCKWVRLFAHFRTAFFRRDLRHAAIARLSHKHCSPIRKHAFQETQALLPFLAFLTSADGSIVSDRVAFFRRDLRHAAIARLSHKHGSSIRRHSFQDTQALLPFLAFLTSTDGSIVSNRVLFLTFTWQSSQDTKSFAARICHLNRSIPFGTFSFVQWYKMGLMRSKLGHFNVLMSKW